MVAQTLADIPQAENAVENIRDNRLLPRALRGVEEQQKWVQGDFENEVYNDDDSYYTKEVVKHVARVLWCRRVGVIVNQLSQKDDDNITEKK